MEKLRVGMIGTGFIGWLHARIYHESYGAQLAAVADSDKNVKKKVKDTFGCDFYTDYHEMLESGKIDAVDICLPDINHVEPAVAAAEAGKHILLEKPMARTAADCIKIKAACDKAGVRLLIAHVLRFDPGYKRLYDAVKSGEVGDVIHLSAERKNSRLLAERLKGRTSMLFYVGVHDIDLVQWCAGKRITRVYAQRIVNINKKWNSEDCIYVLANLGDGTIANFEYAWTLPENFPTGLKSKLEIYGSKSTAFLNRMNQGVEIMKEKGTDLPYELTDMLHWPELNDRIVGDLKNELDHFVDAILKDIDFVMPVEDAISAINVIESIMESYKTGMPVDVKEI
ncbi:MAG TPA: Gfo/Idh/MocA family oxidoreductase [Spirochaetes bacterium]|nr:Gfo/Idh/MocA family oxidoreductase [Spirochaetota bacterium]